MSARKQSLLVVVAVLLLSVVAAHAGEKRFPRANRHGSPGEFRRSRSYVGLGAGYSLDMAREDVWNSQLAALGHAGDGRFEVEGSPVVDGRLGRRFAAHLATELQVEYAVGFDTRLKTSTRSVDAATDWALSMTGNAKVPVLTGRIQPFAIVGVGAMFARIEDRLGADVAANDFGLVVRGGGGLDYYLTQHVVLSAEVTYVRPFGALEDLDYLSIGLGALYQF